MSNWSIQVGGSLVFATGSAPTDIPSGYIAIYASGSDGSIYYKTQQSSAVKIG